MLRWQQAGGRRHALDGLVPGPGGEFRALCGAEVTVRASDLHALGGLWFDPTCWDCDRIWRESLAGSPR
ncbi:zinc finger protein [Amycolatopsis nigrescens]|uniref:zinc finger protein n=1 Tax=Amycolatopsis nigrescens TaxID=381445 RepID=UPI0003633D60|nr:zinc finger protein [Amycolatopsis nigrescens]